jgi:hypothetical protein
MFFNPERPLVDLAEAVIKEGGVSKFLEEMMTTTREPNLLELPQAEPHTLDKASYVHPLTNYGDDVDLKFASAAFGKTDSGEVVNVFDSGSQSLFPDASAVRPAPNRLTTFYNGPGKHSMFKGFPTSIIYDYRTPTSIAGIDGVTRVARGGGMFNPNFFAETVGDEPGTMNVLEFSKGTVADSTMFERNVPFDKLPSVRSVYESKLGIPNWSQFKPAD